MKRKNYIPFLVVVLLMVLSLACGTKPQPPVASTPTPEPPVMPQLSNYHSSNTADLQKYIAGLAGGAAYLAGNPEVIPMIEVINSMTACYQEKGAVTSYVYVNKDFLGSVGSVIIADRNKLKDPGILLACTVDTMLPGASPIRPCGYGYTLKKGGNEFYIAFVGSTDDICWDLCSNLEGCTDSGASRE